MSRYGFRARNFDRFFSRSLWTLIPRMSPHFASRESTLTDLRSENLAMLPSIYPKPDSLGYLAAERA